MEKLIHVSSQTHYEKYAALSKNVPTSYAPNHSNVELLREAYLKDNHLNNIPLHWFDQRYEAVRSIPQDKETIKKYLVGGLSLAENCCILKHILIYRVLGCEHRATK